jgi:hypothetical protein
MTAGQPTQPPTNKPLTPSHVEWLTLIRYQAREADARSREPMPLASLSINEFHDAVEAMLGLITEHCQITRPNRSDFDKLFDAVATHFPALTHHRAPLIALNTARVNFKHHGNAPDKRTVEQRRGNAMDFLSEATRICLDQDFDAISMVTLVRDPEARAHLEEASAEWARGARQDAAQKLRLAFDRLIRDYEQRKVEYPGKTLFTTKPPFMPDGLDGPGGDEVGKYLVKWLAALDERYRLLALGIDLRRYAVFAAYAPSPSGATCSSSRPRCALVRRTTTSMVQRFGARKAAEIAYLLGQ